MFVWKREEEKINSDKNNVFLLRFTEWLQLPSKKRKPNKCPIWIPPISCEKKISWDVFCISFQSCQTLIFCITFLSPFPYSFTAKKTSMLFFLSIPENGILKSFLNLKLFDVSWMKAKEQKKRSSNNSDTMNLALASNNACCCCPVTLCLDLLIIHSFVFIMCFFFIHRRFNGPVSSLKDQKKNSGKRKYLCIRKSL